MRSREVRNVVKMPRGCVSSTRGASGCILNALSLVGLLHLIKLQDAVLHRGGQQFAIG